MKRMLCAVILLLVLLCMGCGGVVSGSAAYDARDLQRIDAHLDDAQSILKKVDDLITWQIESSTEEIENLKNGVQTDSDPQAEIQEIYAKAEQLGGYIKSFEDMKADVDAIKLTENTAVDQTIAAVRHYFSKTTAALYDLMSIFDFYFALEEALAPVTYFDDTLYTDQNSLIVDMYNAVDTATNNLKSIPCPPFMEPTFSRFIKQFGTFNTALESLYMVSSLQAYEVYDVLRLSSIDSLLARLEIQNNKYIILLTEDINLQYQKVAERLETRLSVLHTELKTNIGKLLTHTSKGGL